MSYCLAIDIGASSGRHLLGEVKNGKLETTEIYRFENGLKKENGALVWDIEALTEHVITGIARCGEMGVPPATVSIDTWGVDYVLFDGDGREILPCYAYRDSRTEGVPEEVFSILPERELYGKTGIQRQNFNTLYQLYADKKAGRLDRATDFLMMPEYLSYRLTGVKTHEYTICSTSNLLNAATKTWDLDVIDTLSLPRTLFGKLLPPATLVGHFTKELRERVGFDAAVVTCPSHDTAAAVAACPLTKGSAFISSGTWSLVGAELTAPVTSEAAMRANLSNEGGIEYRFRFLKNIMGMWLFQSVRRDLEKRYTYDEMMHMAEASSFTELIDPTNAAFLAPDSMIDAVRTYLGKPGLPLGDLLSSIYHSLAASYQKTVAELEEISGKQIDTVAIVGGGCKDDYLNRLTARYTGKRVTAGPVECTATGNILAQLMYLDPTLSLDGARELVKATFGDSIKYYEP